MISGFYKFTMADRPTFVYLLYHGQELVYVGQSCNLSARLSEHRKSTHMRFNGVYYQLCFGSKAALALEAKLIFELNPTHNLVGKRSTTPHKYIDLAALGFKWKGEAPMRRI